MPAPLLAHVASAGLGVLGLPAWVLVWLIAAVLVLVWLGLRASLVTSVEAAVAPSPPAAATTATTPTTPSTPASGTAGATATTATTADADGDGDGDGDGDALASRSPVLRSVRGLGAVVLALLLAANLVVALAGPRELGANLAPIMVFTTFWAGGAWLAVVVGPVWTHIDPFFGLGRLTDRLRPGRAASAAPTRWWTAPLVLLTFVVMWTVDPLGGQPRRLGNWLVGFTAVAGIAALVGGRRLVSELDPFPEVLDWGARVLHRRARRAPSAADARTTLALAALTAGGVVFDRLKGTTRFLRWAGIRTPSSAYLENIAVYLWLSAMIAALWWGAGLLAGRTLRLARPDRGPLLADSLGIVAIATLLARTLSTLVVQAQNQLVLASDPFAEGHDWLHTVNWRVHQPLSPTTLGWLQFVIVVGGHAAALVAVRDRCRRAIVESSADGAPKRSQRLRAGRASLAGAALVTISGVAFSLFLLGA